MATRSSSEEKPKRQQKQVYESDGEESDYAPPPRRRGQRQQQQQQQQGPLDNLQLGNVGQTAGGLVGGVTNTLGGVAGNAVDQKGGGGGKSDTLRLRLDLNLDIEITLKAKIHGDLELALLYVPTFPVCSGSLSPFPPFSPAMPTQWIPASRLYIMYTFSSFFCLSCFLPRLKVDVERREQEPYVGPRVCCTGWRDQGGCDGSAGKRRTLRVGTLRRAPGACRRCTFRMSHENDPKNELRDEGANSLGTEATRAGLSLEKLSRFPSCTRYEVLTNHNFLYMAKEEFFGYSGRAEVNDDAVLYYHYIIALLKRISLLLHNNPFLIKNSLHACVGTRLGTYSNRRRKSRPLKNTPSPEFPDPAVHCGERTTGLEAASLKLPSLGSCTSSALASSSHFFPLVPLTDTRTDLNAHSTLKWTWCTTQDTTPSVDRSVRMSQYTIYALTPSVLLITKGTWDLQQTPPGPSPLC